MHRRRGRAHRRCDQPGRAAGLCSIAPPAADPARRRASSRGWRKLAASPCPPVMAAGFGLVLVGAVGTSGILNSAASGPMPESGDQNFANIEDAATPLSAELSGGAKQTPTDSRARPPTRSSESAATTRAAARTPDGDVEESISVWEARRQRAAHGMRLVGSSPSTDARLPVAGDPRPGRGAAAGRPLPSLQRSAARRLIAARS